MNFEAANVRIRYYKGKSMLEMAFKLLMTNRIAK